MNFGTLDFNNLVLLVIAAIGLVNTIIQVRSNRTTKATNILATETKAIALKTEVNTNSLVAKLLKSEKEVSRREGMDQQKNKEKTP